MREWWEQWSNNPDAQPDAPPTTAAPGPGKTPRAERWAEEGGGLWEATVTTAAQKAASRRDCKSRLAHSGFGGTWGYWAAGWWW